MITVVVYKAALGLTETKWVESSLLVAIGRWTGQKQRSTQSVLGSLQAPLILIARCSNIPSQLLYLLLRLLSLLKVVVGVPGCYLQYVVDKLPNTIEVAAQNCYKAAKGAFTGELAPAMIQVSFLLQISTIWVYDLKFSRTVVLVGWSWGILKEEMCLERLMN